MPALKNSEAAAKYKAPSEHDRLIHVPGKKGSGFKCRVSELTLEQADKLFAVAGQNHLEKIEQGKSDEVKPSAGNPSHLKEAAAQENLEAETKASRKNSNKNLEEKAPS